MPTHNRTGSIWSNAAAGAHRRLGPGTTFDLIDTLQAGQSLHISAGEVLSFASPTTDAKGTAFHSGWVYLGLGGAGAAAAAAGLARGGGKQPVSPSGP